MADIVEKVGANVPSADLNGPAAAGTVQFREIYDNERDKRVREEGVKQFINPAEHEAFKSILDDPWVEAGTPANTPIPDGGHCKVLIIGAGFGGILNAVKQIKAGVSVEDILIVDPAGDFGGTWYWNRYPGLMCDIESYCYLPLLEEMGYMPKHKYSSGEEIRLYAKSICEKYDLQKRGMFQSSGKKMVWDAEHGEWKVTIEMKPKGGTNSEITVGADFVVFNTGVLNNVKLPDVEGGATFKGQTFHTARWNYNITGGSPTDTNLTGLKGKRVGIIGTGATAVQAVPQLAKWVKELTIFQRTPSSVDERNNKNTDPTEWKNSIANKPGWQRERIRNFNAFVSNEEPKPEVNLVDDGWTKMPSYSGLTGGPYEVTVETMDDHINMLHELDLPRTQRVRQRAKDLVKDPETASSLQAFYPSWCKRPCFHDDYLPTFNQSHVNLVNTNGKGIDRITPEGIVFEGKTYEIDILIWGTGFMSPIIGTAASKAGIEVYGVDGESLEDKRERALTTLHGVISRGFPNMFFPGPQQTGASANQMVLLDTLSSHNAYIVAEASKKIGGRPVVQPTEEAEDEWGLLIMSTALIFAGLTGCTPSYMTREGEVDRMDADEQMKAALTSIWGRGIEGYMDVIEEWQGKNELEGLDVTAAGS